MEACHSPVKNTILIHLISQDRDEECHIVASVDKKNNVNTITKEFRKRWKLQLGENSLAKLKIVPGSSQKAYEAEFNVVQESEAEMVLGKSLMEEIELAGRDGEQTLLDFAEKGSANGKGDELARRERAKAQNEATKKAQRERMESNAGSTSSSGTTKPNDLGPGSGSNLRSRPAAKNTGS